MFGRSSPITDGMAQWKNDVDQHYLNWKNTPGWHSQDTTEKEKQLQDLRQTGFMAKLQATHSMDKEVLQEYMIKIDTMSGSLRSASSDVMIDNISELYLLLRCTSMRG